MAIDPPLGVRPPGDWFRDDNYVSGESGVLDAIFSPGRAFIIEAQEEGTREEMWLELVLYVANVKGDKYIEFGRVAVHHADPNEPDNFADRVDDEIKRLHSVAEIILNVRHLI